MKTIQQTIYSFNELSAKAKQKAISEFSDINVDYDWWEFTYDDAEEIGLTITGFDMCAHNSIEWESRTGWDPKDIAEAIIKNHGKDGDTYKAARKYLDTIIPILVAEQLTQEEYNDREAFEELGEEFGKEIAHCYWKMLEEDYQYRQTDEAIIETINANDYEFYKDGTQYVHHKSKAA